MPEANERESFAVRRRNWETLYGQGYGTGKKRDYLFPLLYWLDNSKKLGRVIVDAGSGSTVMKAESVLEPTSGVFYPREGKKIIRVEIGLPDEFTASGNIAEVLADIERTQADSLSAKKKLVKAAKFLGIDARADAKPVDTILFSDILNYVDYRKAITGLARFLKVGGRLVIANEPERGYRGFFSANGVKSNRELIAFLKLNGFEIEHLSRMQAPVWRYNRSDNVRDEEWVKIIAVKKSEPL